MHQHRLIVVFFFFNDTATTEIYTLSLHDALPIYRLRANPGSVSRALSPRTSWWTTDRKSTRLNSSHSQISYAVFCLKKKKKKTIATQAQQTPAKPPWPHPVLTRYSVPWCATSPAI